MRRLEVFLKRILPVIALMAALSAPALAGNYTALPDKDLKSSKSPQKQEEAEEKKSERACTKTDKKNIDAYAQKLEKYEKASATGAQKAGMMDENEALRKDYMQINEDFAEFLQSEKFEEVRESHRVCGVEIPKWDKTEPFWLP